jgi:hypothetical protein
MLKKSVSLCFIHSVLSSLFKLALDIFLRFDCSEKTRLIKGPTNQVVIYGVNNSFQLTCLADSDPSTPLQISWLHNGVQLPAVDNANQSLTSTYSIISGSTGSSTLAVDINSITGSMISSVAGTYTCVAWNGYSIANASAVVTVEDFPANNSVFNSSSNSTTENYLSSSVAMVSSSTPTAVSSSAENLFPGL